MVTFKLRVQPDVFMEVYKEGGETGEKVRAGVARQIDYVERMARETDEIQGTGAAA